MPTIIGVDAPKRVHAAVAIDNVGREMGQWRGANTLAGWQAVERRASGLAPDRIWGIEGAGQYGRGLAQTLLRDGERVVAVNPRQTAAMRRGSRQRGKSDRLDARAVARVVLQEGEALPVVQPDAVTTVLAVLVAEREGTLAEATRLRNQLHQILVQLDPVRTWPALTKAEHVAPLVALVAPTVDPVVQARTVAVRRRAARLRLVLDQGAEIKGAIETLARQRFAPLLTLTGVAALTAGMLAAHLAMYAGVAPLEASSGAVVRHRLNRTGNRALNALIYRIAWVQARCHPPAQAYLARR